jgi:hypothetical protein
MRVTINRALLLKKFYYQGKERFRKYDISPGTYFLETREVNGEQWLCLEGLDIGQSLEFWNNIVHKAMIPKCEEAEGFFFLQKQDNLAAPRISRGAA